MTPVQEYKHNEVHFVGCGLRLGCPVVGSLRGNADKPPMRAEPVDLSCGAGLAEDVDWQRIEIGLLRAAIANSSAHSFDDYLPVEALDFDVRLHVCGEARGFPEVRREDATTVDQRCVSIGHLNRSCLEIVTLADCILRTPLAAL